jgi:cell division protein FtsB
MLSVYILGVLFLTIVVLAKLYVRVQALKKDIEVLTDETEVLKSEVANLEDYVETLQVEFKNTTDILKSKYII